MGCEVTTCLHGGSCRSDRTGFSCECSAGYTGIFCELGESQELNLNARLFNNDTVKTNPDITNF